MSENKVEKKKSRKKKSILGNIIFTICILMLVMAVGYSVWNSVAPDQANILGHKLMIIKSDSMAPKLYTGSVIAVNDEPMENVENMELVVFKYNGSYICHRVRAITDAGLVTKGDNNRSVDSIFITEDMYVGKVGWSTNILAEIMNVFKAPSFGGVFKFFILPAAVIIFLISLRSLIKYLRLEKEYKKENEEAVAAPESKAEGQGNTQENLQKKEEL